MPKRFLSFRPLLWLWVPLFIFGGAMIFLHEFGARERNLNGQEFDAIVILGARVTANGQPSPILRARTRRAFGLWKAKRAPLLVCTGGVGDYPPAESVVATQLLKKWGVPESAIQSEAVSTSTRENALEAAKILPPRARVIVVSEPFHLWRACRDFQKAGLQPVPVAEWSGWNQLRTGQKLFYLFREAILVGRDFILR